MGLVIRPPITPPMTSSLLTQSLRPDDRPVCVLSGTPADSAGTAGVLSLERVGSADATPPLSLVREESANPTPRRGVSANCTALLVRPLGGAELVDGRVSGEEVDGRPPEGGGVGGSRVTEWVSLGADDVGGPPAVGGSTSIPSWESRF